MKKLLLVLVSMSAILFCACKDEFPEYPDPNPKPVSVNKQMRVRGSFDMSVSNQIEWVSISKVLQRTGAIVTSSKLIYSGNAKDFDFVIDSSFNYLEGQTVEILFMLSCLYEDVGLGAAIIKNVTFSENTVIGDIGFSEYDWVTHPRLRSVVYGTEIKTYCQN